REVLDVLKEEVMQLSSGQQQVISNKGELAIRMQADEFLAAGLMRGTIDEHEVLNMLRQFGLDFAEPWFTCFVIKLDKASVSDDRYERADPSLFQLYIQQFVQEMLSKKHHSFCFTMSDSEVVAIINMQNETAEDKAEL